MPRSDDRFRFVKNSQEVDSLRLTETIKKEGAMTISKGQKGIATISFVMGPASLDRLALINFVESGSQQFRLEEVEQTFGSIYYFICEDTSERRRKLYFTKEEDELRCFGCSDDLRYECQVRSGTDEYEGVRRWETKARKVLDKLDIQVPPGIQNLPDPNQIPRPQYMTEDRFHDLLAEYAEHYDRVMNGVKTIAGDHENSIETHEDRTEAIRDQAQEAVDGDLDADLEELVKEEMRQGIDIDI